MKIFDLLLILIAITGLVLFTKYVDRQTVGYYEQLTKTPNYAELAYYSK